MNANLIKTIGVTLIAILVAFYVGNWIPQARTEEVAYVAIFLMGLFFILFAYQYAIYIIIILPLLDIRIALGFSMGPTELCGGVIFGLVMITFWRKSQKFLIREKSLSSVFIGLLVCYTTYIIIHAFYNYKNPYGSTIFSIANAGKLYFNMVAPLIILGLFVRNPPSIKCPIKPLNTVSIIVFFSILSNIVIRLLGVFVLQTYGNDNTDAIDVISKTVLNIPVINLNENVFALRVLSPF